MNKYLEEDLQKEYKNISFCTMCFNIGMDKVDAVHDKDGRNDYIEFYVASLIRLCRKFKNIIVFCDKECGDELRKNNVNAFIYQMDLIELEKYELLQEYTRIYKRMKRYWKLLYKESCIVKKTVKECDNALYTVLNNSKIDLMYKASQINPYKSETIIWIDAGCCQEKYSNVWAGWDGEITKNTLKFKCAIHIHNYNLKISKKSIQQWKMRDIIYCFSGKQMAANIFMVDVSFMPTFYKEYNELIRRLIKINLITSEQSIITWMIHEKLGFFDIVLSKGYDEVMQKICNEDSIDLKEKIDDKEYS